MITIKESHIEIHTDRTSYILSVGREDLCETLHYGARITLEDPAPLLPKTAAGWGTEIKCRPQGPSLSALRLELSPHNRGDYRRGALLCAGEDGGTTSDFRFQRAEILEERAPGGGMPGARRPDDVLALTFLDPQGLEVEIFYSVFGECDVITKRMRVTNRSARSLRLLRCLSNQLDLPRCDLDLYNLTGAWAREMHLTRRPLKRGLLGFGNGTGASGNRCNPFFFLAEPRSTETQGETYGFNLVYSGSHEGSAEVDEFGKTRILQGIYSDGFSWPLAPGEHFVTPEAVMTYSNAGKGGMSCNMHNFIRTRILPPQWARTPRPVLVNNWEGTYFHFNEAKIMSMARAAAKAGAELFVLDDGWFGQRSSDGAGLGDYDVNRKKLPSGLDRLAKRINRLGMQFGLWFEPEMVNEDSKLYRSHPDWAVAAPGRKPAVGRNQLVLDLCRSEVREYIAENVGRILDGASIGYVKWDMNRHISDNYSPALQDQGGFMHRYILGLYEVLETLCPARPHILFEGCASGGNRFDPGMLYYMPQIWLSDNTDAHERQYIQTGASYGYPQCCYSCHVSAVPNHQTLRVTDLDTRFNTAMFGVLGYELDMTQLPARQRSDIKDQIEFYKLHRKLLQYGTFHRLLSPFEDDGCRWMVTDPEKNEAMAGDFLGLLKPNTAAMPMRLRALDPQRQYDISVRSQNIDISVFGGLINHVLPLQLNPDGLIVKTVNKIYRLETETERYRVFGDALCHAGLARLQEFSGAGYSDNLRFMHDFASRVYYLKAAAPDEP